MTIPAGDLTVDDSVFHAVTRRTGYQSLKSLALMRSPLNDSLVTPVISLI